MTTSLPRDSLVLRKVEAWPGLRYYAWVPAEMDPAATPVVLVHGISRNAREMVLAFAAAARRDGVPLLAPLFSRELCHHYQQLGWLDDGVRADLLMQEIYREFCVELGISVKPFALFGHSGGAQFAHRFTLSCPSQVARLATCAAGFYTFPDLRREYPFGLSCQHLGPDARFILDEFLTVPTLVTVGSADTIRDAVLRTRDGVDEQQGLDRRERAERWATALMAAAGARGITHEVRFAEIAGARHQFSDTVQNGLVELVWPWLTATRHAPHQQIIDPPAQGSLRHVQ